MNRLYGFLMVLALSGIVMQEYIFAQSDNQVDPDVLKAAEIFRARIEKEKTGQDIDRALWVSFRVDTFTIQKTLEARLKNATERYDASFVWSDAISAYNEMAGKYFDLLMQKMIEVDQKYLQQSQQSWLEYKQAEQILNEIIGRKEYNKSGLVNETYEYSRILNINKNRAAELFNYLLRVNNR